MIRPILLTFSFVLSVFAHQQPTTLIRLDGGAHSVSAELHLPLTEWELAFGQPLSQDPPAALARWRPQLENYLQTHIRPVTPNQKPWQVQVTQIRLQSAEQTQSGAFQEAVATLALTPPAGAEAGQFTLHYDAILHQAVTHKAIVSIGNHRTGVIQVDTETTRIAPLEVSLAPANPWAGARAMLLLGMKHIADGTDHLLFLLVLLLPAPLLANGRHWGTFGGYQYSLLRLLRIVTAFTLGHSSRCSPVPWAGSNSPNSPSKSSSPSPSSSPPPTPFAPSFPAANTSSPPASESSTASPSPPASPRSTSPPPNSPSVFSRSISASNLCNSSSSPSPSPGSSSSAPRQRTNGPASPAPSSARSPCSPGSPTAPPASPTPSPPPSTAPPPSPRLESFSWPPSPDFLSSL